MPYNIRSSDMRIRWIAAFVTAGIALSHSGFAQQPILEYKFNETGTTAPSSGSDTTPLGMLNSSATPTDLHGAAGSGVSGLATDRAFDNTPGSTMAAGGGVALQSGDDNAVDGLLSLTFQGWLNTTAGATGNAGRLFDKNDGVGNGYFLGWNGGTINLQLDLGANVAGASSGGYTSGGNWIFFAATYDGTTGLAKFYQGTTDTSVSLINTSNVGFTGTVNDEAQQLGVGNGAAQSRAFAGLLDDMRIFGSTTDASGVLTVSQLEDLRLSDVPEASTWAMPLLGAGLLVIGGVRRRYRRFKEARQGQFSPAKSHVMGVASNNS